MVRKLMSCALSLVCAAGLGAADLQGQIDVSSSVDFYYTYNLNKEDPALRTFDVEHNSFTPAYAEVVLERATSATNRIGGRVDVGFGTTADIVASFEPGGNDETFRNLQQAYISVAASDNLTLDFGKFVTPLGAEVIESQNNWNYSRSILFGFAVPFYHSGVRATYAASEQLSLSGYLVNGANNSVDTNNDKTIIAAAGLTPSEQLSWFGNVIVQKDTDFDGDGEQDLQWVFDTTLSYGLSPQLTLMGNFDYGRAANADAATAGDPATFWGLAAYARFQSQPDWALAGRFEYINDESDGAMGIAQKVQSFTATSDHTVFEDLIARIEFRFDITDNDLVFTDADGDATENQPTIGFGLVYELN